MSQGDDTGVMGGCHGCHPKRINEENHIKENKLSGSQESNADDAQVYKEPEPGTEAYKDIFQKIIDPKHKPALRFGAKCVLEFMNHRCSTNYRPVDSNLDLIIARLKSGVTVLQCIEVVESKREQWSTNPELRGYLRPSTIFGKTNFEQYLGQLKKKG